MPVTDKKKVRSLLRKKRRSLALDEQQHLSEFINHTILKLPEFLTAEKIAVYLAQEMEVDLSLVIQQAWHVNKTVYLPLINEDDKRIMKFCMYEPNDKLILNRVNILEPSYRANSEIHPSALDLVLLPLVAFNSFGHRVGRGGGYYDATFQFRQLNSHQKSPTLIGVAYDFQKVNAFEAAARDVNLDKVITEKQIYDFAK